MPWQKLLYRRQPFPDNYTHLSFLDQLKRNTTVAKYPFRKVLNDHTLLAFYALLLIIVNDTFVAIYTGRWLPHVPAAVSLTVCVLCAALNPTSRPHWLLFKAYTAIATLLLVFSPALRSLSQSTSLDLIWALSAILTAANACYHEYAPDPGAGRASVVSTNLSVANALVLASRLPLSLAAFSFIVFSLQVLVLVPLFDLNWRLTGLLCHEAALGTVYVLAGAILCFVHGKSMLFCYVLGLAFLLLGLPLYFVSLQRYKNELQGPWDMAHPVIRNHI